MSYISLPLIEEKSWNLLIRPLLEEPGFNIKRETLLWRNLKLKKKKKKKIEIKK